MLSVTAMQEVFASSDAFSYTVSRSVGDFKEGPQILGLELSSLARNAYDSLVTFNFFLPLSESHS